MSANFRTQQVKLRTEEIYYVNMSFHKLQRRSLIDFGKLGLYASSRIITMRTETIMYYAGAHVSWLNKT